MLAIGTRFFGKDSKKDLPRLEAFLTAASFLGKALVAINADEDKTSSLAFCQKNFPDVDAFTVTPWQKFVAPLNAIVYRAAQMGANRLLLASAEFPPQKHQVDSLLLEVDSSTLVAGARFADHGFQEGAVEGNGVTVPWNTFAVWNLGELTKIGFPLVGDAPFDQKQAGVEEVSTIALYQELYGLTAKLVSIPGFYEEWNMAGWDDDRIAKHRAKIASKISRPQAQIALAGFRAPTVIHIA